MKGNCCEWAGCHKTAKHNEVYWGEVLSLCDEHYDLIGKDSDYETENSSSD